MLSKKNLYRPIFGTFMFQPFALLWCYLADIDYLTSLGPFTIYATFCFIPIYTIYDKLID